MTEVTMLDGPLYTVQALGHATGSEQVCAAVSTLCYTLASWLKMEGVEAEIRLESGDAFFRFPRTGATEMAFDVIFAGFYQLAANYPQYVSLTHRGK